MTRPSLMLMFAGLVFVLYACSTSPPVHYFALQSIETEYRRDPQGAPLLSIGPLRMPDYLKRSQMVSRGRGTEMIVDDFNRWAEPLDGAIHTTIATNVDSLLSDAVVVAYPHNTLIDVDYRFIGRITRFDVDMSGNAVLDIQWGIGNSEGEIFAEARRTTYTSRADQANDPASMAQAMSEVLDKLSRDIVTEMEALIH